MVAVRAKEALWGANALLLRYLDVTLDFRESANKTSPKSAQAGGRACRRARGGRDRL